MNASGSLRPSSVRIGMFCKLGSFEDKRPVVVVEAIEKTRCGCGALAVHVERQGVGVGALQLGQLAPVDDVARQQVALGGEVLQHLHKPRTFSTGNGYEFRRSARREQASRPYCLPTGPE